MKGFFDVLFERHLDVQTRRQLHVRSWRSNDVFFERLEDVQNPGCYDVVFERLLDVKY